MKLYGYSIYDAKAEAYTIPNFNKTEGLAVRGFDHAVTAADSPFAKNPEDYSLFLVAEFDDDSGAIQSMVPLQICTGLERVAATRQKEFKLRNLHAEIDQLTNPPEDEEKPCDQ